MSGYFTRKMYDGCATQQNVKQSTNPLELILDVTKYVHSNNICKPASQYPPNSAQLVDVESSLWGIDKIASNCDTSKHPFCGPEGCLLTNDPRVPPHITPYACERGQEGDNAVITTNMKKLVHPGFTSQNANICNEQNRSNGNQRNPSVPKQALAPLPILPSRGPSISKQPTQPSSSNFAVGLLAALKQFSSDLNQTDQTPICKNLEVRIRQFANSLVQQIQQNPETANLIQQLIEGHKQFFEDLSTIQQSSGCPRLNLAIKNYFVQFGNLLGSINHP